MCADCVLVELLCQVVVFRPAIWNITAPVISRVASVKHWVLCERFQRFGPILFVSLQPEVLEVELLVGPLADDQIC